MLNIKKLVLEAGYITVPAYWLSDEKPVACSTSNFERLVSFAEALISAYKEELLKEVGEPVATLFQHKDTDRETTVQPHAVSDLAKMNKRWLNCGDLYSARQVASAILKATKPLEEDVERLKTVPMKYRRMAFNAQLQDENKELRAQLAAVQEECEFQRNAHKQAEELMLEQGNQLAAAQEEIERLRIALDCTKTDLVRMRCPDFFEGVKDGYEILFDGHLVNMIGLINDYAKQK